MDEDQQYERFEDNDFEGGQWVGSEYLVTGQKKRRAQTKDEQLYGYDSDNSDEDRRKRGKGPRKQADYTRPVGFVSSGVVKSTDDKEKDVEAAEHGGAAGLGSKTAENGGGLGFVGVGSTGGGLGFAPAREPQVQLMGDEDEDVLPTSFGKRYAPS